MTESESGILHMHTGDPLVAEAVFCVFPNLSAQAGQSQIPLPHGVDV